MNIVKKINTKTKNKIRDAYTLPYCNENVDNFLIFIKYPLIKFQIIQRLNPTAPSKFNLVVVNGTCLRPYLNSVFNGLCKNLSYNIHQYTRPYNHNQK